MKIHPAKTCFATVTFEFGAVFLAIYRFMIFQGIAPNLQQLATAIHFSPPRKVPIGDENRRLLQQPSKIYFPYYSLKKLICPEKRPEINSSRS